MLPKSPWLSHHETLDGLRGLAVLLVLLWHAYIMPLDRSDAFSEVAYSFLFVTRSGVDLFFVLSGFLITRILLQNRSAGNYYTAFYLRRFFRIAPLYYLLVAGYLVIIGMGIDGRVVGGNVPKWSYLFFMQNYFSFERISPALLAVTWSLAVEEQFYLFFPILIRNSRPEKLLSILVGIAVCSVVLRWILCSRGDFSLDGTYVWTVCRLDSLLIGSIVAVTERYTPQALVFVRKHTGKYDWFLLALIFLSGPAIHTTINISMARWGYLFFGVIYGIILVNALGAGGSFGHFLKQRPLMFTGKIAYGLYLIHWPLLYWASGEKKYFLDRGLEASVVTLLALVAAYLLAVISYYIIEEPIRNLGRRLGTFC